MNGYNDFGDNGEFEFNDNFLQHWNFFNYSDVLRQK